MTLKSVAKFELKLTYLENDMRNLINFYQSTWKSRNWDFAGILLSKVENLWASNLQRVMCHDSDEWWKIWRGNELSFQNWHEEFDECWHEHLKVSNICTLSGSSRPKYIKFEPKKYRGVMHHHTEDPCKLWRKN